VNPKLDYKSPTEFPRELRRSLFRLSALFELADEQFSELRDARNRIAAEYAADVRSGQLDIPLDEASIAAYIQDSGKRELIERMIRAGGGTVIPSTRLTRDRSDLLTTVRWAEIGTIEELDRYLAAEILPVSLTGTAFFDRYDFSVEDALTTLILADKKADEGTYSGIYADAYADFAPKIAIWQTRKHRRRG
jgi:putative GTP pyrophosphokinase